MTNSYNWSGNAAAIATYPNLFQTAAATADAPAKFRGSQAADGAGAITAAMSPGSLINRLLDLSGLPLDVTVKQSVGTVDDGKGSVFTPQVPKAFGVG